MRMHPDWMTYLGFIGTKMAELDADIKAEFGDAWVYDFYPRKLEIAIDGETVGHFRIEDDVWGWEEATDE